MPTQAVKVQVNTKLSNLGALVFLIEAEMEFDDCIILGSPLMRGISRFNSKTLLLNKATNQ